MVVTALRACIFLKRILNGSNLSLCFWFIYQHWRIFKVTQLSFWPRDIYLRIFNWGIHFITWPFISFHHWSWFKRNWILGLSIIHTRFRLYIFNLTWINRDISTITSLILFIALRGLLSFYLCLCLFKIGDLSGLDLSLKFLKSSVLLGLNLCFFIFKSGALLSLDLCLNLFKILTLLEFYLCMYLFKRGAFPFCFWCKGFHRLIHLKVPTFSTLILLNFL